MDGKTRMNDETWMDGRHGTWDMIIRRRYDGMVNTQAFGMDGSRHGIFFSTLMPLEWVIASTALVALHPKLTMSRAMR